MSLISKQNKFVSALIAITAILVISISASFFYFLLAVKPGPTTEKEYVKAPLPEIFELNGFVKEIDILKNCLAVEPLDKTDKVVKVFLANETKIFKIEFPFDIKNPPRQASYESKETTLSIQELQPQEQVFIKTTKNIAGKKEFNGVISVEVLP